MTRLSPDDRARIAAAVTAAERASDAEVAVIASEASDTYHDIAAHLGVLLLFLLVAVQAAVPGHFVPVLDLLTGRSGWEGTAGWTLGQLLSALLLLLASVYAASLFALRRLAWRVALTPRATRARRVRRRALLLFRASVEARTATRTGALVYVSLAERQAEIVADAAIVERVAAEAWAEAMRRLVAAMREGRAGDGLVAAVEEIGRILAEHFPHTGTDPNELPDRVIEL